VYRGKKRKALQMQAASSAPATAPALSDQVEEPESPWIKERRKSWAALIKLIYEADPLLCPKCRQPMLVIAFIRLGGPETLFDLLSYPSGNHKMGFVRGFLTQPKKAISYARL
jgi:hypothetical protein